MKVSEARQKLCPFISTTFAADTTDLRTGGLIEQTCICSDCMAWKYTKEYEFTKRVDCPEEKFIQEGWEHWDADEYSRKLSEDIKEGYCVRLTK